MSLRCHIFQLSPFFKSVRPSSTIIQTNSTTRFTIRIRSINTTRQQLLKMPTFKLLNITADQLKPGFMKECEVEGVKDGKVLVVQYGSKVRATSPKCPHYSAPLSKGTLTEEGRIVCPFHGSCFRVDTGEIEDAPSLDSLHSFPVTIDGDQLSITAEESAIKSGRRIPNMISDMNLTEEDVLIVGGGSGAIGTIEGLRQNGYKGKITVLSKEDTLPIDRPKLSKMLVTDISKVLLRDEEFYKKFGVEIHTSSAVKSVDFDNHSVTTEDGKNWKYKKLVLASGGTPKKLPMNGFKTLKNIFVLRSISTTKAIMEAVGEGEGKNVVVVGSSFIGMEVANCLVGKKHNVTVVGMEDVPLERVMGKKVGASFQTILEKKGVKFQMGASVEDAVASDSDSSKVGSVQLKGGTKLEADLVILGVGVAPETSYLDSSMLQKDNSVLVDENFKIKGKSSDAYAVGDIATYPYHGPGADKGSVVRIEHWNVAQNSGRAVGAIISGGKAAPFIPVFWSALGVQLRYCGNTVNGYDDIHVDGDLEANKFIAYYSKGDVVVAVATMQRDPVMVQCSELMRRGAMPSKSELEKGLDILSVIVPAV